MGLSLFLFFFPLGSGPRADPGLGLVSLSFFLLGLGVVTLRHLARPTTPCFYGVVGFGVVQTTAQNN